MRQVFEFLDYREILRQAFEEKKIASPLYSYRMLAESFGLDTSNVFRILHGDSHLPARCIPRAIEFLGLAGRAAEYFQLLIAYARERNATARTETLEKAISLRDVARRQMADKEMALFRDWWVVAVRCLLEVVDGNARPDVLAAKLVPEVSEREVGEALDLLLDLGLVKKASSGRLVLTDAHLTAGFDERKVGALRHFQRQVLGLAADSMERFPREQRDVSTLTLAVDRDAFREIRGMLVECRRQIQKRIEDARHPDRVMQLTMAFFPVAPSLETIP